MDQVFEKTRDLANAIMQSEIYIRMKNAEERALHNEEAAMAMATYLEKRHQIEALLESAHPDNARMHELSEEMEDAQNRMQMVPDVVEMTSARNEFTEMINQVNRLLKFIITGEMDDAEEVAGGCSGSCSTCGGNCGVH